MQLRVKDPSGHNYDNIPPEVGFVAAGVVVLKMVYGLDGRRRYVVLRFWVRLCADPWVCFFFTSSCGLSITWIAII